VTLRIAIDRELCQGHGVCMDEAPDVFLVIERAGEYSQTSLLTETPPEDQRARVEAAVRGCPNRALKLVEQAGAPAPARSEAESS
jgi:ferredoxin